MNAKTVRVSYLELTQVPEAIPPHFGTERISLEKLRVGEYLDPDIELKNFGLVAAAQSRGLGSWLLRTALHAEWKRQPGRIWLHTDDWDHPAAAHLYESAGFRVYRVREESPADL